MQVGFIGISKQMPWCTGFPTVYPRVKSIIMTVLQGALYSTLKMCVLLFVTGIATYQQIYCWVLID